MGHRRSLGLALFATCSLSSSVYAQEPGETDAASDEEVAEEVDRMVESWEGVENIEDLPLEDLLDMPVTGSSRYEQSQASSPNPTTVITSDDIRAFGWRTLADALRSLRGVYITNDRNYEYVGVRGYGISGDYNSRVLVLIDGHRVNEPIYDSTYPGFGLPIDLADVERIEVVRGPASSVYGANAFFGVINVITRTGARRNAVTGAARAGSHGYGSGYVGWGQRFQNGIDVTASVSGGALAGDELLYFPELDDPATANGIATNQDRERFMRALASMRYGDFSLVGTFGWREKEVPTAAFATIFDDPEFETMDSFTVVGVGYDGDLGDGWTLAGHATFNHYEYLGLYPNLYDLPPPTRVVNRDEALGNWVGADLQIRKTFLEDYTLSVGADYRYLLDIDQRNFDIYATGPDVALDVSDEGWVLGAYVQAQARFFDDVLTIDGGARFDAFYVESETNMFDTLEWALNPRAAVIVAPTETTILRALYGSAFRAANAYERFYVYGDPTVGGASIFNPDLTSERIQTVEVVAEQYLGPDVRALIGGYYYHLEDLIRIELVDALDNYWSANTGSSEAFGLEVEVMVKVPGIVRGWASYALQRTEDELNAGLTNSPTHLAKLAVAFHLLRDQLFLSGEVQYMSPRSTDNGGPESDHQAIVNVTLFGQAIVPGLSFTVSVRNLFDQRYGDPASIDHLQNTIPQTGRTLWAGLQYDLAVGSAESR